MPIVQREPLKLDDREYRNGDGEQVEATETVEFEWKGKTYRTYLSADNAESFEADMAPWTEFAEVVTTERPTARRAPSATTAAPRTGARSRTPRNLSQEIRDWCIQQSFEPPVGKLGRIPDRYTEAFFLAHPDKRPDPA